MKQLLACSCFGLFLFFSCKKPADPPVPPSPPPTPPLIETLNGWQKINTNITADVFQDIAFNTPANGLLATTNGVYKSSDSGKTWLPETSITGKPTAIKYFNQQYGYGVGDNQINLTSNGGISWRTKNSSVTAVSTDVCFIDPATGYMAHHAGNIYKTIDTGHTWYQIGFASNGIGLSIFFLNEQNGWYSSGTNLLTTMDGGSTWSNQKVANSLIQTVYFTNPGVGWLTADSSVYRTTDGGRSWSKTILNGRTFDLEFLNAQTGYVSTETGVWKTMDGGVTWKQDMVAQLPLFSKLIFLDENTGWVIGQKGIIYRWKK